MIARRVALGSASNAVGKAIGLGTWFLLTPIVLGELGPVGFGIWVVVGSLASYGYLLDLGIAGAVIKIVAEHRARGDWNAAHDVVAAALRVYWALGAVMLLLATAAAVVVPAALEIPEQERSNAAWATFLAGTSIAVSLAGMPATAVLRGLQRYDLYNVIVTCGTVAGALATVLVLAAGGGLVGIVAVNIPVTLLTQVASVLVVRRVAPELRFGWRGGDAADRGRILRFSGPLFAMNLSRNLQTRTDEVVIAAFLPVASVTPYALARRLSELALLITDQFVKVLLPLASELDAAHDVARLRSVYLVSLRLTLAMIAPVSVFLIVFAEPILVQWVGERYAGAAPLVAILATAGVFRGMSWPAATVLQGMDRHRWIARLSIATGIANLGLSIVLVGVLGVVGVAIGTLVPAAVEALLILPHGLRAVGVGVGPGLRSAVLPPILAGLPSAVVLVLLDRWLDPSGLGLLLAGALGVAVYGSVYLALRATRPERDLMVAMARSVVHRSPRSDTR